MSVLEERAELVQGDVFAKHDDSEGIKNIIIILMIISIIISIIRLWMSCRRSPEHLVRSCANPSPLQKTLVRRYVAAALREHPEAYDICGRDLADSIFKIAAGTPVPVMDALFDEVAERFEESSLSTEGIDDAAL